MQFKDGKVLFVDGKVAFGLACCCAIDCADVDITDDLYVGFNDIDDCGKWSEVNCEDFNTSFILQWYLTYWRYLDLGGMWKKQIIAGCVEGTPDYFYVLAGFIGGPPVPIANCFYATTEKALPHTLDNTYSCDGPAEGESGNVRAYFI